MKIIKSARIDWLDKEGYSKKVLFDEIDRKGVVVQEVKIKAGETAKSHYHKKQTEIFYFLNKNGYWMVNGEKQEFEVGEVLIIEPGDKHEVVNNSKEGYLYLAFKYDYDPKDLYWEEA